MRKDPVTSCALRKIFKRFEETEFFAVQAGRGRKNRIPQLMDDVATTVVERASSITATFLRIYMQLLRRIKAAKFVTNYFIDMHAVRTQSLSV